MAIKKKKDNDYKKTPNKRHNHKDSRQVTGLDVEGWPWEWEGNKVDVWDEKLLI